MILIVHNSSLPKPRGILQRVYFTSKVDITQASTCFLLEQLLELITIAILGFLSVKYSNLPNRKTILATGEHYHVFNRGVNKTPMFINKLHYKRGIQSLNYYQSSKPPMSFSKFLKLSTKERSIVANSMKQKSQLVTLLAYCLMPNHFHLLLRQEFDNGISDYLRLFQNSYTRYFNLKQDRIGPLWQGQFKAVHIEDDDQLLHTCRYIHLNPLTSFLVKDVSALQNYHWSSFQEYIKPSKNDLCKQNVILSFFNNTPNFVKFTEDQASYQQSLKLISHLTIDE